jgi:hypothetical protein
VLALAVLAAWLGLGRLNAQVIVNPNYINGSVRFTNTNPIILSLLGAPSNLGMAAGTVLANSLPPTPAFQDTATFTASSPTGGTYQVAVDSDSPGISYAVSAYVNLQPDQDIYFFAATDSAPVVSNLPPVTVNLGEGLTLLDIRFVSAAGIPVPVTGGRIAAYLDPAMRVEQAYAPQLAAGATNRLFAVRGGTDEYLDVRVSLGTNPDYDGFTLDIVTNVTTVSDQVIVLYCLVPDTNSLGRIIGNVSLAGEFLEHTTMEAAYGPFYNQRVYDLPGVNFTVPASGPFYLTNLLPSTITAPPAGYYLYARMQVRTNLQYNFFNAPTSGGGNPLVMVPAGGTADLSNIFNITPGYFDGELRLLGPAETSQPNSILRGVTRFIEYDPSPTGIPASANSYGNYASFLQVAGVGRFAAGASHFTAYGGMSEPSFPGSFNPSSSTFEGSYEAVVGGLGGENSVWKYNGLNLLMRDQSSADENTYYLESLTLYNHLTTDVEVAPGLHYTNDVGVCFSEVSVRFRSSSGRFFAPRLAVLSTAPGNFSGTDFQGQPANYTVDYLNASGTPLDSATATNTGLVRLLLPQGNYTLYPTVSLLNTNGGYDDTGLPPITLTVGCQQRILLDQCLQLNLDLPGCVNTNPYLVAGSVTSCTNVVGITFQLDGGPTNTVCNNCGFNPAFSFPLTFSSTCSNHTLLVTTRDAGGQVSSASSQIALNSMLPAINCSTNLLVWAPTTNMVPVTFNVTATSFCTGGPATVVCSPPSGSLFPAGTNTVSCYAVDACGNTNTCSFLVTVISPPRLTINLTRTNTVVISWPSLSPGFVLQQTPALAPSAWVNVSQTPADNGTTRSVVINPPTGDLFFRLANP